MSVSPDRYYLIFHVKAFRIPERHLIHVSPFEARLSKSTVEFGFRSRSATGQRAEEESYFEKSSPIVKCHNFFRHPTRAYPYLYDDQITSSSRARIECANIDAEQAGALNVRYTLSAGHVIKTVTIEV